MLRRHLRRFLFTILAATVLVACGGSDEEAEPTTTEPEATVDDSTGGERTDESVDADAVDTPAPDQPGPYAVGRRTEQVVDANRDDRALTVEVWYPAADAGETTPYELLPGVTFTSDLSTVDAPPSGDGPFPLVVFSHGSGGLRQQSTSIVETIASHGFVVVAPDHAGNTAIDQLLGTETERDITARNRVLDTRFLIDVVEADGLASELADADRVAVMGHSFGGYTALAVAGGAGDLPPDPRVDAIVPLAPASGLLPDDSLAAIEVPMLIVTGSEDETTPVDDQSTRPLELAGGPATFVEIEGGGHAVVTNICDIIDAVSGADADLPPGAVDAARSQAGSTCDPDAEVDVEDAFDITEHYSVSFLRQHLADDERYADPDEIEGATIRS
ncbi:MAG: prolyl oligopeptidase family serine peptidase [Acidimicrobiales bacterium]|nr:prolyl oligopeptidase family serine peptidase [Acidimicrobiales bacterium]